MTSIESLNQILNLMQIVSGERPARLTLPASYFLKLYQEYLEFRREARKYGAAKEVMEERGMDGLEGSKDLVLLGCRLSPEGEACF